MVTTGHNLSRSSKEQGTIKGKGVQPRRKNTPPMGADSHDWFWDLASQVSDGTLQHCKYSWFGDYTLDALHNAIVQIAESPLLLNQMSVYPKPRQFLMNRQYWNGSSYHRMGRQIKIQPYGSDPLLDWEIAGSPLQERSLCYTNPEEILSRRADEEAEEQRKEAIFDRLQHEMGKMDPIDRQILKLRAYRPELTSDQQGDMLGGQKGAYIRARFRRLLSKLLKDFKESFPYFAQDCSW